MASRLEVLNLALAALNEDETPAESGDAASNAGIKTARFLDSSRDLVLASHNWKVARTYVSLNAAAEDGDFRYPYRFYLPGDCLRVWAVETAGVMWEAGSRLDQGAERLVIRSDSEGPLDVVYIRRVDWAALGAHLLEAISLTTAARACLVVNGNRQMKVDLSQDADAARRLAIGQEARASGGQTPMIGDRVAALRRAAG